MFRLRSVLLVCASLLALAAPLSLAAGQAAPPSPARLAMDPPTQIELAALAPAATTPLIRGGVFYDQDGDGSAKSPLCDRGQRDLTKRNPPIHPA